MAALKKINTALLTPWFIVSFLFVLVLCYLCADKPIAEYFYQLQLQQKIPGLIIFTELGKGMVYFVFFAALFVYFKFIFPQKKAASYAFFLLLCIFIPNLICLFLKTGLGRARPELWLTAHEFGFYGFAFDKMYWSFPSSHTSTVLGLFLGLSLLFPQTTLYLLIPAMLLIISRILLYQHYLSDVLSAMYLTFIAIGFLEHKWLNKG